MKINSLPLYRSLRIFAVQGSVTDNVKLYTNYFNGNTWKVKTQALSDGDVILTAAKGLNNLMVSINDKDPSASGTVVSFSSIVLQK
jgi:hypothetical protein